MIGRRGGGREEHLTTLPGRRHLLELLHALRVEAQSRAALHRVHEAHHPRLELLGARQPGAQLANLILRVRLHLPQPHHLLQQQQPVALQLLHLAGDAAVRAQLQSVVAAAGHVRRSFKSAGFNAGALLSRRRRGGRLASIRLLLLVSRRVVPAQRGEQLGFTLLEPLHAELEPVAVALAEAVVVELPDERREVAVLERGGQLRGLEQVGLPHGERAALRGPGDDVVAAGVADEVPRFPAGEGGGGGTRRRQVGVGGAGGISDGGNFPDVCAPRNFLGSGPGRARGREAEAETVASSFQGRVLARGRSVTRAVEMAPAGGAAGGRGADPRRHPRSRSSTCQKKKKSRNRGLRPRAPPRGGTHHRNGDTFTVANGVEAPVALPGWALAPLAEVMCRESDLLSAVCLEVTTGVTRWKTKGLEPQKKT